MRTPPERHARLRSKAQRQRRRPPETQGAPALAPATRAAIGREEAAIRNALTRVVGAGEAERLLGLANSAGELPDDDLLPARKSTAWTRAGRLAQTADGRARLRTLTWDTI